MMEENLRFATQKPLLCPECGSTRVVRILYGMPGSEMWERFARGEIALGGCCISGCDPSWRCLDCETSIYSEKVRETVMREFGASRLPSENTSPSK